MEVLVNVQGPLQEEHAKEGLRKEDHLGGGGGGVKRGFEDGEENSDQRSIWKEQEGKVAGEGILGGDYVGKQGHHVRLCDIHPSKGCNPHHILSAEHTHVAMVATPVQKPERYPVQNLSWSRLAIMT